MENVYGYEVYTVDELIDSEEIRNSLIGRSIKIVYTNTTFPEVGEFAFHGSITTITPEFMPEHGYKALYVWTEYAYLRLSDGEIWLD